MSLLAEVWLGDLARSLAGLNPHDNATRLAIAHALGLELAERPLTPAIEVPQTAMKATQPPLAKPLTPPEPAVESAPGAASLRLLEPVASGQVRGERPWEAGHALPELPEPPSGGTPRYRPLFAPALQRELLIAVASADRPDGDLDARAIVDILAHGRPIVSLPRLPRRGLAREVQLLIDTAAGMEPYTRDRWAVVEQFRDAVGEARLTAFRFCDLPLSAAGPGPIWTWKPYIPPAEGATVIAVTDLGIGAAALASRTAREDEWLRLAALLRRRSSRLVALVPYRRDRWPQQLRVAFPIVTWDRTTGVADVARALRLARA